VIEIIVQDSGWRAAVPNAVAAARRAAATTLRREARADANVTILLADDAELRTLNARFRGQDAPTNVLSFPALAQSGSLGDIAVALGVCQREAADQGKPLAHHLQHLTAHGVLHLLGYDHDSDAEAEVMEAKERQVLAALGVPDPYAIERGREGDHG
jgi:probable rRNA maturation factor